MGICRLPQEIVVPSSGPTPGKTLDEYTWDEISYISSNGLASEYGFQVGDTKEIILNGIVGSCELSNYQTRAFIIGINHNAELEGNNLIHLQVGLGMLTGGSDIGIALVDDEVNYSGSSPAFRITTTTVMGMTWGQSYMRNSICGTSLSDYPSTSFLAVIPDDLRSVLKPVTKYTSSARWEASLADITATTEYIFLPSEYEIFATNNWASQYEAEKQQHYSYYMDTNTRLKAKHNDMSRVVAYWTCSSDDNGGGWCVVTAMQKSDAMGTTYSYGFTPCFCV